MTPGSQPVRSRLLWRILQVQRSPERYLISCHAALYHATFAVKSLRPFKSFLMDPSHIFHSTNNFLHSFILTFMNSQSWTEHSSRFSFHRGEAIQYPYPKNCLVTVGCIYLRIQVLFYIFSTSAKAFNSDKLQQIGWLWHLAELSAASEALIVLFRAPLAQGGQLTKTWSQRALKRANVLSWAFTGINKHARWVLSWMIASLCLPTAK